MHCRLPILNAARGLVKLSCNVNATSQLTPATLVLLSSETSSSFARHITLSLQHTSQGEVKGGRKPTAYKVGVILYMGYASFEAIRLNRCQTDRLGLLKCSEGRGKGQSHDLSAFASFAKKFHLTTIPTSMLLRYCQAGTPGFFGPLIAE